MRVVDTKLAYEAAVELHSIANQAEDGHVKAVFVLTVFNVEAARDKGYALEHFMKLIDSVGPGEYLLLLGALRDFYLDMEDHLMARGRTTEIDLTETKPEEVKR